MATSERLRAGARVGIIGGGPAGSLYALHLLRFARSAALPLQVTILERKDFGRRGQQGCNKCAGILSTRLVAGLREIELEVPPPLVMARLDGYTLHIAGAEIAITQPEWAQETISVYRGAGPLHALLEPEVSFDAWLLREACAAGAEVLRANARAVTPGPQMAVRTEDGSYAFDLVVLATGVNARPPSLGEIGYVPPKTQTMVQDEISLEGPALCSRQRIQVYVGQEPGLLFGALIPKGDMFNISLLGRGLGKDAVGHFLGSRAGDCLAQAPFQRLCGCYPQIAVSPAGHLYGDRFVTVGDAAVTRLYKGGLTSAFLTARQAAWATIHEGDLERAFARGYGPLCRAMAWDDRIGHGLFWLWEHSRSLPGWEQTLAQVLLGEQQRAPERRHGHLALWAVLTGDSPYRRIARDFLHPHILRAFAAAAIR